MTISRSILPGPNVEVMKKCWDKFTKFWSVRPKFVGRICLKLGQIDQCGTNWLKIGTNWPKLERIGLGQMGFGTNWLVPIKLSTKVKVDFVQLKCLSVFTYLYNFPPLTAFDNTRNGFFTSNFDKRHTGCIIDLFGFEICEILCSCP